MKNYSEFLFESKVLSLILEGEFTASAEFCKRIKWLSSANKVASELSRIFNNAEEVEKDLSQNYIDVTDKDDVVSFLSDTRAGRLNFMDSPYLAPGRSEIKIGRFARSILSDQNIRKELSITTDFIDKDYEEFVNYYKAANTKKDYKFELVKGKQIAKYYDEENYASEKGDLGNSCMKYESCQDYFDIYTKNEDKCSLLVYLDSDNQVLGRALIWKLDKSPCDSKQFMDRIYTANDSDRLKFFEWANSNNCLTKYKNNSETEDSYFFKYKGQLLLGEIRVELKKIDFDEYPYVDTLRFLNKKEKYISNIASKGNLILDNTDGDKSRCYGCDGSGVDTTTCDDCSGSGDIECKKCGGTGKKDPEAKKKDTKKCKKCEGNGRIDCQVCKGEGYVEVPCSDCEGKYKSDLETMLQITGGSISEIISLIKSEVTRMDAEDSYRPR
jgi:hypothetical protein